MMKFNEIFELIKTINSIIVMSIPLISIILYLLNRKKSFLVITLIYTIEFLLFIVFSNELNNLVKNSNIIFLFIINIGISIETVKYFLLDSVKEIINEVEYNKTKFNINQNSIKKSIDSLAVEGDLHLKYKEKIYYLNEKINKSIGEANIPVFILDSNRNFIYGNEEFEKIANTSSKFCINKFLTNTFLNGEYAINYINEYNSDITKSITLETFNNEFFRFTNISDSINDKNVILCILNDITQSTIIENQLKISEARYRNLMDILSDGVIIHNENNISYINNRAKELFNVEEIVTSMDSIKSMITINSISKFEDNINSVHSDIKYKSINKIKLNDGKIVEVITTKLDLSDNKMMLSLIVDITSIEISMEELEQSEKTYKLLLQELPEGIMIIDNKSKNQIYRNTAIIKMLKDIGIEKLNNFIKSYISKGEYGKFKDLTIKNKTDLKFSIAVIYMYKEDHYLVVARKLQNENRAEKVAEKLSEVKEKYRFNTEFLSSVTKDLRNPISIISNINNLLDLNSDKYNLNYMNNYTKLVRQNCYRLVRLLNNVEEIDKIDNGIKDIQLKKCNMVNFIGDIVSLSKTYTERKELDIQFKANKESIDFFVDKDKFESIILNLLSNSIKFTNSGGKILVSVDNLEEKLVITIEDTGVGIPKNKLDTIFESFEQIDRTLSRGTEGTGIGLSLVKKFVQIHEGHINVKSELGKGSKFELVFKPNLVIKNQQKYVTDFYADKEKMDIEFSDIYFNVNA